MSGKVTKVSSFVTSVGRHTISFYEFDTLEEAWEFHKEFRDSFEISSPYQSWSKLPIREQKWTILLKI